ncbi:DUF3892 domain-containing protein [Curtobacterium sp. SORGH_AS_0776]|uniref:DUF3892 domain-containing protein n=1 Tax=Curtobacterium sp. SORGH_AS_0776 TaxID=3041798 RepID=UPI0028588F73|nr:DUF3892 domain-containing protein [Curtobacterium sp. SORGH_AS_0776]MDR6170940.1 hypothetical protein [Curtobacterium sp. SORGH_AS_0776]
MTVQITHVRFGGTTKTESSIVKYRWVNPANGKTGDNDKSTMVAFLEQKNATAYVGVGSTRVPVGVVRPESGAPYLRTYADGKWTNNLVNLPTF